MSFMIVNTGRAASRAFYLNLRAQTEVLSFSRDQFDQAVTDFITAQSTAGLESIAAAIDAAATIDDSAPTVDLVFHGVRPRLGFPFESQQNIELLTFVRDRIGIDTIFLSVREPADVLRSEMNRRLAAMVGDWAFPDIGMGWAASFTPSDISALRGWPIPQPLEIETDLDVDYQAMATQIAERSGKVASLFGLFASVFLHVHLVSYEDFVESPAHTFDRMAALAGFAFDTPALVGTPLNGLTNRFLVYNPITLDLGPGRRVRFRFEVEGVIGLCDDWGVHLPLDVDTSDAMASVSEAVAAPIGLGVDTEDLAGLVPAEQRVALGSARAIVDVLGRVFAANCDVMDEVYRQQVYLAAVPDSALETFMEVNAEDISATEKLLRGARAGAPY